MPATAIRPLKVDLRGKTPDEVVSLLTESGFTDVIKSVSDDFKHNSLIHRTSELDQKREVWKVTIDSAQAPSLTVIIHNGSEHALQPGHDLYFFEGEEGGWGWARSYCLWA
ncbi:hypothetical protein BH11PAT3_BH11PAT3_0730 [soil metagenome]